MVINYGWGRGGAVTRQGKYMLSPGESEGEGRRGHVLFILHSNLIPSPTTPLLSLLPPSAQPLPSHAPTAAGPLTGLPNSTPAPSSLLSTWQPERSFMNVKPITSLPCLEPFNSVPLSGGRNPAHIPQMPRSCT